jgi:hypothetical protein
VSLKIHWIWYMHWSVGDQQMTQSIQQVTSAYLLDSLGGHQGLITSQLQHYHLYIYNHGEMRSTDRSHLRYPPGNSSKQHRTSYLLNLLSLFTPCHYALILVPIPLAHFAYCKHYHSFTYISFSPPSLQSPNSSKHLIQYISCSIDRYLNLS